MLLVIHNSVSFLGTNFQTVPSFASKIDIRMVLGTFISFKQITSKVQVGVYIFTMIFFTLFFTSQRLIINNIIILSVKCAEVTSNASTVNLVYI